MKVKVHRIGGFAQGAEMEGGEAHGVFLRVEHALFLWEKARFVLKLAKVRPLFGATDVSCDFSGFFGSPYQFVDVVVQKRSRLSAPPPIPFAQSGGSYFVLL